MSKHSITFRNQRIYLQEGKVMETYVFEIFLATVCQIKAPTLLVGVSVFDVADSIIQHYFGQWLILLFCPNVT